MMQTELKWLTPEGVQNMADDLVPFFQRVVDAHPDGSYSINGILFKLFRGEWTAWIITQGDVVLGVSATCVTSDMKFRRIMRVLFLAGDRWLEWGPKVLRELEVSSQDNQIYANEFVGRSGFQRTLPDYKVIGNIYRKVVNPDAAFYETVRPNVLDVGRA